MRQVAWLFALGVSLAAAGCTGDDPVYADGADAGAGADADAGGGASDAAPDGASVATSGGTPDPDFTGGAKDVRLETLAGLAVDANGAIWVAGVDVACTDSVSSDMAVARVLPSGSVDTAFGDNGRKCYGYSAAGANFNDAPYAIGIDPAGRIVLAGRSDDPQSGTGQRVLVVRLLASGELDPSFGVGGFARLAALPEGRATAIAFDGDIIWIAGQTKSPGGLVMKIDGSGTPVAAFDTDGALVDASVAAFTSVAPTAGGVVVSASGPSGFVVKKLDAATGAAATFGSAGTSTVAVSARVDVARTVIAASDGAIFVAGSVDAASVSEGGRIGAVRLLASGSADTKFSFTAPSHLWTPELAHSGFLQPDGKLVLAGYAPAGRDLALVRLGADGALDATFGADGVVVGTNPNDDVARGVARDPRASAIVVLSDDGSTVSKPGSRQWKRAVLDRFRP